MRVEEGTKTDGTAKVNDVWENVGCVTGQRSLVGVKSDDYRVGKSVGLNDRDSYHGVSISGSFVSRLAGAFDKNEKYVPECRSSNKWVVKAARRGTAGERALKLQLRVCRKAPRSAPELTYVRHGALEEREQQQACSSAQALART